MIGIDIVEISEIDVDKLMKILTDNEKAYVNKSQNINRRREVVAGIYAGKEAVFKCMNFANLGLQVLNNIEINHNENGRPYVCYCGEKIDIQLSISHTKHTAVAVALN